MDVVVGQVLASGLGSDLFDWPHRVLAKDAELNRIWLIALPRQRENGRSVGYMTGPTIFEHSVVVDALRSGALVQAEHKPAFTRLSDADFCAEASSESELIRRVKRLQSRDRAYTVIKPIVEGISSELLAKSLPSQRDQLQTRAKVCDVDLTTMYRLVHLFLANGSVRNGLIPCRHRCGGPGRQRVQRRKLGRKTNAFKRGDTQSEGYVLVAGDKEKLAMGYALISKTRTPADAFLLTSGAFWGSTVVLSDGTAKVDLYERHLRPSRDQFDNWGKQLNTRSTRANRLGLRLSEDEPTHHGGSTQDLVCAVGQIAMIDATSTDTYLTSIFSRRRKLPPMTRTLVKELRTGVIVGFYAGWESPSPTTALLAILCGAEDKVALCARFGITITADQWPSMLCRRYLADNGEMRASRATEAEIQIGFGIEFARTYSGESKGDVESQHRTDHKKFDHRVPGSSKGRQRKRGEPHPADAALWNYYEYMRELLEYIIDFNNSEAPRLAPLEMKRAGIRPTRINIFKWLCEHNERADIPVDLEHLRALTLPEWPAVMQYNGIVLKTKDGSRNIPDARFFCDELREDHRFASANSSRKVIPIKVRAHPEGLEEIWLPMKKGLVRVPNVFPDRQLTREATVEDLHDHARAEGEIKEEQKQATDQRNLNTVLRREGTTTRASRELRDEEQKAKQRSARVSKRKQRSEMRVNTEAEINAVAQDASKGTTPPERTTAEAEPIPAKPLDAATAAMNSFLSSIGVGA